MFIMSTCTAEDAKNMDEDEGWQFVNLGEQVSTRLHWGLVYRGSRDGGIRLNYYTPTNFAQWL